MKFCTEARGSAKWVEWACCLSEAIGYSIRATCEAGPTRLQLKDEVARLSAMWYRLVYEEPSLDDQIELVVMLGLVPVRSAAYQHAVSLRDLMFPVLVR